MTKFKQFPFSEKEQNFIRFLDWQKHIIMLAFGIPNTESAMSRLQKDYGSSMLNQLFEDYHAMKIIEKYNRLWEVSHLDAKQETIERKKK